MEGREANEWTDEGGVEEVKEEWNQSEVLPLALRQDGGSCVRKVITCCNLSQLSLLSPSSAQEGGRRGEEKWKEEGKRRVRIIFSFILRFVCLRFSPSPLLHHPLFFATTFSPSHPAWSSSVPSPTLSVFPSFHLVQLKPVCWTGSGNRVWAAFSQQLCETMSPPVGRQMYINLEERKRWSASQRFFYSSFILPPIDSESHDVVFTSGILFSWTHCLSDTIKFPST